MGTSIARHLAGAGHDILLAGRDMEKVKAAAATAGERVRAVDVAEAADAEMFLPALWYPGTVDLAREHAAALAGKIVIDIANPLDETFTGLSLAPTTSAAEELVRGVDGIRVVKAFNTVPGPVMSAGSFKGTTPLDVFVASDDAEAKQQVLALLGGSVFRGVDAGSLANARLLERMCAFGIELSQRYDLGFEFAFKFLPEQL